ncbi:MAG: hypothetical protein HRU04_05565 [Oceanospirillaceae bacterium]|nr:hypothetical protein [Oceanospirillaceae bacterium]
MSTQKLYPSKEIKTLLQISDCELMHRRSSGALCYEKKGAAYFYQLPDKKYLLNHPLADQLINWHREKHKSDIDNTPTDSDTKTLICDLLQQLLIPIQDEFGEIKITYGFTSAALNRYIQKISPTGTCPAIDQHSALETNKNDNQICKRGGLACDFTVANFGDRMNSVTRFVIDNLNFDKLYYYDTDKPIHLSISETPEQHLQTMSISKNGRRIPGKKAYGTAAKLLAAEL